MTLHVTHLTHASIAPEPVEAPEPVAAPEQRTQIYLAGRYGSTPRALTAEKAAHDEQREREFAVARRVAAKHGLDSAWLVDLIAEYQREMAAEFGRACIVSGRVR